MLPCLLPQEKIGTGGFKGRWGLFHRDPKRIVGVLRLTLLNRLNSSREWAELPLGRQTLHHDWLSGYRGLQKPLFILSLGIELAHSFNLTPAAQPRSLSEATNFVQPRACTLLGIFFVAKLRFISIASRLLQSFLIFPVARFDRNQSYLRLIGGLVFPRH